MDCKRVATRRSGLVDHRMCLYHPNEGAYLSCGRHGMLQEPCQMSDLGFCPSCVPPRLSLPPTAGRRERQREHQHRHFPHATHSLLLWICRLAKGSWTSGRYAGQSLDETLRIRLRINLLQHLWLYQGASTVCVSFRVDSQSNFQSQGPDAKSSAIGRCASTHFSKIGNASRVGSILVGSTRSKHRAYCRWSGPSLLSAGRTLSMNRVRLKQLPSTATDRQRIIFG